MTTTDTRPSAVIDIGELNCEFGDDPGTAGASAINWPYRDELSDLPRALKGIHWSWEKAVARLVDLARMCLVFDEDTTEVMVRASHQPAGTIDGHYSTVAFSGNGHGLVVATDAEGLLAAPYTSGNTTHLVPGRVYYLGTEVVLGWTHRKSHADRRIVALG
jgi:hypothetical protein